MSLSFKKGLFHKLLMGFLIVGNLILVSHVIYNQVKNSNYVKVIPTTKITNSSIIKDLVNKYSANNPDSSIAIALLTSASTSCSTGRIVEIFKETAQKSKNAKLVVLLPNTFSLQDVENFKSNLKVNFEVEQVDEELAAFWNPIAEEYEAKGVVIVYDENNLTASQDTKKISKQLETFK